MIKHLSLGHGWFYHYRVHEDKTAQLCKGKLAPLADYLNDMFKNCPDDKFHSGPRSSHLTFDIDVKMKKAPNHEVCQMTKDGLEWAHYKTAHSNVQCFMLQNDTSTIGVEVPIWLDPHELKNFNELFEEEGSLTGHIDALSVEDNKIWIWDYKPKAAKEKYAHVQTLFYAIMLSKRTGIPLKHFRCGYFDADDCFVFKPEMKLISQK